MTLSASAISSRLPTSPASYPSTHAAAGVAWADAIVAGSSVDPTSSTVTTAGVALRAALGDAFAAGDVSAADAALVAFAAAVGLGMTGYTAVPPTTSPDLASVWDEPTSDAAEAAEAFAAHVVAWMATGNATPTGGGPTVFWG